MKKSAYSIILFLFKAEIDKMRTVMQEQQLFSVSNDILKIKETEARNL